MGMVIRGDVWLTMLDPVVGSELRKTRPCLIVSPDELNKTSRTFLAVPMTSGGRPRPFRPETIFAAKPSRLLPEQIRVFDRSRFIKRLGCIDDATLNATLIVLQQMFAR